MKTAPPVTETVVRHHLQAFVEQKEIAAIVDDYDDEARLYSEAKIYRGKQEIHGFFSDFIASLPAGAIDRFTVRNFLVDRDVAYITWCVGSDIPLGTDTFVVKDGKIVSQTFAMYAPDDPGSGVSRR
jgi:ketosteroid isomerase-like protein